MQMIYFAYKGKIPFFEWLDPLDNVNQARIRNRLTRMAKGHLGDCKLLAHGLYETRFFFGSGYRIYFTIHHNQIIIILCAGDKKTQSKDIALAQKYLAIWESTYYASRQ